MWIIFPCQNPPGPDAGPADGFGALLLNLEVSLSGESQFARTLSACLRIYFEFKFKPVAFSRLAIIPARDEKNATGQHKKKPTATMSVIISSRLGFVCVHEDAPKIADLPDLSSPKKTQKNSPPVGGLYLSVRIYTILICFGLV
jgi:hypothetical protein